MGVLGTEDRRKVEAFKIITLIHWFTDKSYRPPTQPSTLFSALRLQKWAVHPKSLLWWTSTLVEGERIKNEWVDMWCLPGDKCHREGQSRQRDGQDGKGRAQPFLYLSVLSVVGWEIISVCFLRPCPPLTNLFWLCLCGLFSKWDGELVHSRSGAWLIGVAHWNLLQPNAQLNQLTASRLVFICLQSYWILLLSTHNRVTFYSGIRSLSQGLRQTESTWTLKSLTLPLRFQYVWFSVCNQYVPM